MQKKDSLEVFDKMGGFHPNESHWYLPLLGVDPFHHGKGLCSALIKYTITKCDQDNKIAYLESSNPTKVPFYQRRGFEILGTFRVNS